jgi:hypothetical protein
MVQAGQGKKQDPISKITRAKRTRGMAHGIEHLPSKCELKFNPYTITKIQIDQSINQ